MNDRISHDQLLAEFSYDAETGTFTRLIRSGHTHPGPVNNVPGFHGYVYLSIHNRKYTVHRLAWFYMTRKWPKEVDHINGLKADNRFCNLRIATRAQNEANKRVRRDSQTGVKGVTWDPYMEMWFAYITINYKMKNLGRYERFEDAVAVRTKAARERDGEFFRAA